MSHGVYLTLDDSFGGGRVLLDVCRLVTWSVGHSVGGGWPATVTNLMQLLAWREGRKKEGKSVCVRGKS